MQLAVFLFPSSHSVVGSAEVMRAAAGSAVEANVRRALAKELADRVRPSDMIKMLTAYQHGTSADISAFVSDVAGQYHRTFPKSPVAAAMAEIADRAGRNGTSYAEAADKWFGDARVDAGLKANYLIKSYGKQEFERLLARVPEAQRDSILSHISKGSNILAYRENGQHHLTDANNESLTPESFEFKSFSFAPEGAKVHLGEQEVVFRKPF